MSESTEIVADAIPIGLGAIVTQKDENGDSHVIAYGSRSLTQTEQRYSQTEREALAVACGCEHYHLYCYGKPVTVYTDHKPLTSIFSNPLSRPKPRIERWSFRLQPNQPNIVYAPGSDNPAGYPSRYPWKQTQPIVGKRKLQKNRSISSHGTQHLLQSILKKLREKH